MTRLRQVLIIALGLLAATVMAWLGVWQLDVYRAQGEAVAARWRQGARLSHLWP